MSIYRVQSGLIFDDNFETFDSRWVVSPSDSCYFNESDKTLTLNHNNTDRSTNALFPIPQDEDELLIQVHSDYTPKYLGDEGGIVIWKNALEKVEFLESEDTSQIGEYNKWRAVKRQNLWTFFAEKGNAWELFDSTVCVNPTMAGVVLKGVPRTGYVPLIVDRVVLCRGTSISVGNLSSHSKVELVDVDGSVVKQQDVPDGFSGIEIELPSIPFRGKLKVYEAADNDNHSLVDEQDKLVDMYGGDVFLKGTDLKVIWKGKELNEVSPTNLGSMKDDEIEQQMTVLNDSTENIAENVEISIAVYDEEFGWEWCSLAEDDGGVPGQYENNKIVLGTLSAGESKNFWVKVSKQPLPNDNGFKQRMRPTHFFLEIRNN